jgi:hypothetical protein
MLINFAPARKLERRIGGRISGNVCPGRSPRTSDIPTQPGIAMTVRYFISLFLMIVAFFPVRGDENGWVVGSIAFQGNDHLSRRELLRRMSLHSPGYFTRTDYNFSKLVDDIAELGDLYYDHGFLHVAIEIDTVILDSS